MVLLADIGSGGFIVIAIIVLALIGTVYGLKTRKGSGINDHPGQTDRAKAPGEDAAAAGTEEDKDSTLSQRGTK